MKSSRLKPSDLISVLSSFQNIITASDSRCIREGTVNCLLWDFAKDTTKAALANKTHAFKEGSSYHYGRFRACRDVDHYPSATYAFDDCGAEAEVDVIYIKQPDRMSAER